MAVKVMVAPAIVKGDVSRSQESAPIVRKDAPKPRRRKSAVFDADGNEVFITLMCLKCHKMKPLSQFGLRKMADGAIRNQPWCRPCRSGAGAEKPHEARREATVSEGSAETAVPAGVAVLAGQGAAPPAKADPNLAAQIATALYRGRA
jgi:hypothetical protein